LKNKFLPTFAHRNPNYSITIALFSNLTSSFLANSKCKMPFSYLALIESVLMASLIVKLRLKFLMPNSVLRILIPSAASVVGAS
jgi:hypothetical protein